MKILIPFLFCEDVMITTEDGRCPRCGCTKLKYLDKVSRILRTNNGVKTRIKLRRFRCMTCGAIHRELPSNLLPYKQYDAKIIFGVIEGRITSNTLGYEDYPCEMTMHRWLDMESPRLFLQDDKPVLE